MDAVSITRVSQVRFPPRKAFLFFVSNRRFSVRVGQLTAGLNSAAVTKMGAKNLDAFVLLARM